MGRNRLTRTRVAELIKAGGDGFFPDGGGLYLQLVAPSAASWIFRYQRDRRQRQMGLGSARDLSLEDARTEALALRLKLRQGVDPLVEREAERAARKAAKAAVVTFKMAAADYIATHTGSLSAKAKIQWPNTMRDYVYPVIGDLDVRAIDTPDILRVLHDPAEIEKGNPTLWQRVPETAKRVQDRMRRILASATTRKWRSGPNPAAWEDHLSHLLPAPEKGKKVKRKAAGKGEHFPALPWRQVGAFMVELRAKGGIAARGLEYSILAASRPGEARKAKWSQIRWDERLWDQYSDDTKRERPHTVPLSDRMIEILQDLWERRGDSKEDFIFPSSKPGVPLSDAAMGKVIKDLNEWRGKKGLPLWVDPAQHDRPIVPHGFRSCFADWRRDATAFAQELAEAALAHAGDKVEMCYVRGDALDPRRRLMEAWDAFCAAPMPETDEVVTPFRKRG